MGIRLPDGGTHRERWSRRHLLGAATAVVAAGLAGCGRVTDYEFGATPVVLEGDARRALGYERLRREPIVTERSRPVGGVDVTVTVESQLAVYGPRAVGKRATAAGPIVSALSTPRAVVMGRSFNPLARLSVPNLLTSEAGLRVLREAGVDEVGSPRARLRWERGPMLVDSRGLRLLGTDATVGSYAGLLGGDRPAVVFVHLGRVTADSVVVVAAVHGRDVDERDRAFVGPDSGYLSPAQFDRATATVGNAATAFRYGRE